MGCGPGLLTFLSCFWTLTFSGESAAEYAANSGLLRKRRPSSPPIFGRGGEKPPPIPKWEGRRLQTGQAQDIGGVSPVWRPPPPLPFSGWGVRT